MPKGAVATPAFALVLLLGVAAAPAAADDPCTVGVDSLAPLDAAVDAAAAGTPDRRSARRLASAAASLEDAGADFASRALAFAAAARKLEPLGAPDLDAALADSLALLLAAFAVERDEIEGVLAEMPSAVAAVHRQRLADAAGQAEAAAAGGLDARAGAALAGAARRTLRIRNPRVATFGGPLRVVSIDAEGDNTWPLNRALVIRMSADLDPSSVRPDTVPVRGGIGFGRQVDGTYEVRGPVITFRPRLPRLADGSDSGLSPGSRYRVSVPGSGSAGVVRDRKGRHPPAGYTGEFGTAVDPAPLWDARVYPALPPPRVTCTEPADLPPVAPYATPGGAVGVPTDVAPALHFPRVPLSPASVAAGVSLWMTDFRGEPREDRVDGTVVLEQDHHSVRIVFRPKARLADASRYALRVSEEVTDLSGLWSVPAQPERSALYAAALLGPKTEAGLFAKAHPRESDPRTFLVFTTADEPAVDAARVLELDGSDLDAHGGDGVDRVATSAAVDAPVPGAVAARSLVAAGTGVLGPFAPTASLVLDADDEAVAPGGEFHYRSIHIPPGVTVTVTGSRPAILRASESILIEGTLDASGAAGDLSTGIAAPVSFQKGGRGGPGGGAGADASKGAIGTPGGTGGDAPGVAGGGGLGGEDPPATFPYGVPGGGGGGGHATAGKPGVGGNNGGFDPQVVARGEGGSGGGVAGAAPSSATTDDGRTFAGMGGAGGGSGGNFHYVYLTNSTRYYGAGGGGGGGALLLTCGGSVRISGSVLVKGGSGGNTHPSTTFWSAGAGGGGAGGSLAIFAEGAVDVSGATLDAGGGALGANVGQAGRGGAGGDGAVRLETPGGTVAGLHAASLPVEATLGVFDPAAREGDPPSVFTSGWFDLGVHGAEFLPLSPENFGEVIPAGGRATYEIQAAADHPAAPGPPPAGGAPAHGLGSPWLLLKDGDSIFDPTGALQGKRYRYFRIRVSLHLPEGARRADPGPLVERFTLPYRRP